MLSKATQEDLYFKLYSGLEYVCLKLFQNYKTYSCQIPFPPGWPCLGCSWSCQRLLARWASASLATASNVSSLVSQTFVCYMWHVICIFVFCDYWMYVAGKKLTTTTTTTMTSLSEKVYANCCHVFKGNKNHVVEIISGIKMGSLILLDDLIGHERSASRTTCD